jgi:hypothetical protein
LGSAVSGMGALFDEILRRRKEIEETEQIRQRGLYQHFYRHERSRQERADARKKIDSDTLDVLKSFCQSAYPSMQLRSFEQGWSIGRWMRAPDNSRAWESIVDIILRYDNQDRPVSYDCRGHNRHLVASLTPEALRQTLLRIYRPQQANAAGQPAKKKR